MAVDLISSRQNLFISRCLFSRTFSTFQDLHTDILLEEVRGKQQPAVHVFAMSLRYMKEHLLRAMKTNLEFDPDPLTIRWVLTVPAIWDENSKQFMREAAHRVG